MTTYSNYSNEKRYIKVDAHPTKMWPYGTTSYELNNNTGMYSIYKIYLHEALYVFGKRLLLIYWFVHCHELFEFRFCIVEDN